MNRQLFDKPRLNRSVHLNSSSKRYQNWYDDQYKPLRRKIVLDTPDPILHRSTSSKQLKFFGDPTSFRSMIRKTDLSQRSSNIFKQSQTQLNWKPSVKKIVNPQSSQYAQRKHVILTDYTNKYRRNPIASVQQQKGGNVARKKRDRNPIVEGQERELLQRKGRKYRPCI